MERGDVQAAVVFHEGNQHNLKMGTTYLRGFGSFIVKKRAQKTGRNISKNTTIVIPAHYIQLSSRRKYS